MGEEPMNIGKLYVGLKSGIEGKYVVLNM